MAGNRKSQFPVLLSYLEYGELRLTKISDSEAFSERERSVKSTIASLVHVSQLNRLLLLV